MLGYTCKYTPIEVFESLGVEIERISPDVTSYDRAETMMHANMCSFVKGVLEEAAENNYEGIILTTCCDSTRRLYDTLKENYNDKFIYMLDLPRKTNEAGVKLYENSIINMIKAYEEFSGKKFDEDKLRKVLNSKNKEQENSNNGINVGLMGARCNDGIINLVKESGGNVVFNISCTGDERNFDIKGQDVLQEYTGQLLHKLPCIRMEDISERRSFIEGMKEKIDGVIYHTVKFCDMYSYEYAKIKNLLDVPVLKVETDYTKQCEGQIKTRVEAFIESLNTIRKDRMEMNEASTSDFTGSISVNSDGSMSRCTGCDIDKSESDMEYKKRIEKMETDLKNETAKGKNDVSINENEEVNKNMPDNKNIYVLGIDSGSTSTNAVIMNGNKEIVAYHVVRTGAKSSESARSALCGVLEKAGITREDLNLIVSTGYGRVSIDFADKDITEISCHGRGAHYLNPEIRTIIDIGGQDSKVIKLNEKGEVVDFAMNDKCAAGTGRFLEMMAKTLEIDIKEMGEESLKWKEAIKISSMCSVFAESEVISLIAQNKEKCDIIHALNESIAGKTNALLGRVGKESRFMMSGGVAQNIGVVKALEEKIGEKLFISNQPEIVGAIGGALFALDEIIKK